MKKRMLSMTLALVMVLALLPFAALAAEDYDLSPYAEVLEGAGADVFGTYYDLDGDQSPELLLTRGDAESFAVDIYTLADGAIDLATTGDHSPADIMGKIDAAKAAIIAGEKTVPTSVDECPEFTLDD